MIKFIDKYSQKIFKFLFVVLCVSFILACFSIRLPVLYSIFIWISIIAFAVNFFVLAVKTIVKIKYSFYNIKHCGIECFEKIDALKSFWNNDKSNNYKRQISYINYCYSKDGPVGKLIDEGNLADLYVRKDFLNNNINFSSELIGWAFSSFSTITFSLFSKDFFNIDEYYILLLIYIFPPFLCFFYFICLR